MKKITFINILLILILAITFSSAENELFSKPLEELELDVLLEMKTQIDNEILGRFERIDGVVIEPGLYVVGEDIPEGNYYFEGVEGRYSTSIHVYPSIDEIGVIYAKQDVSNIGYGELAQSTKSGKVILKNGEAIKFVQGPAIIHPYMGLMN